MPGHGCYNYSCASADDLIMTSSYQVANLQNWALQLRFSMLPRKLKPSDPAELQPSARRLRPDTGGCWERDLNVSRVLPEMIMINYNSYHLANLQKRTLQLRFSILPLKQAPPPRLRLPEQVEFCLLKGFRMGFRVVDL